MDERVFVVVPAYNEAPIVEDAIRPLIRLGYSVVVVDDGSTDGTYDRCAGLPVHLLRHPINLGQGAALQTGMTFALERGAEVVVHFDADGQHPAGCVEDLLAPIRTGEAEVVLGSRFLGESPGADVPVLRRWVLRAARVFTGLNSGIWLTDAHNGLRALTRAAAGRIRITESRMAHASEVVDLVHRAGMRYVEVPVRVQYTEYSRRKGQSALSALEIVLDLLMRRIFVR